MGFRLQKDPCGSLCVRVRYVSRLLLAALVCDEVGACLDDEIGVLSSFAAREWVKSCVQDPEALMRLLLRFQRKETEDTERPLADDHEQTDDDGPRNLQSA